MSGSGSGTGGDQSVGLPDHEDFEQYIVQADVDRDPFAVALFEVKPIDSPDPVLLRRLGQTLLQFASPTTQIAFLGRNRFGLISHTDDTTQRWVAPVTTALRTALEDWWTECGEATDSADLPIDVSDLSDQPVLMTGVARGLSREVWLNAEQALARAYKQRIPLVEHQPTDGKPNLLAESAGDATGQAAPGLQRSQRSPGMTTSPMDDDRLVVLGRRLEPVDRPEPVWHWLRLLPGLRTDGLEPPTVVDTAKLRVDEQALLEVWLASQVAGLFADATTQLRVSIPLSAEALRARSFAQRIFPLLERHRVPPSRLVAEIDMSVITRSDSLTLDSNPEASAPSVERFVSDAASVNVEVAVSGFDGGWGAWYNLGDLPIKYVIPSSTMMFQAGQGDEGAIRSLVLLAAEAEQRGLELIAPRIDGGLSVHALAQIGFSYGEGALAEARQSLGEPTDRTLSSVDA